MAHFTDDASAPLVRFSRRIDAGELMRLYDATGFSATGRVGVKVTLEAPSGPHVNPELIAPLVRRLDATLVDCNGFTPPRNRTESHFAAARANGFDRIGPVDILDARGDMELPITGGRHLSAARTGAHLARYDSLVAITRFKGHHLPRYGGVLKSLSICLGSIGGKARIHSLGATDGHYISSDERASTEAMADAVKGALEFRPGGWLFIGVMDAFEPDDGDPDARNLGDVGIFASADPVALDQAMLDIAYGAAATLEIARRWTREHMTYLPACAEAIGAGSTRYRLEELV